VVTYYITISQEPGSRRPRFYDCRSWLTEARFCAPPLRRGKTRPAATAPPRPTCGRAWPNSSRGPPLDRTREPRAGKSNAPSGRVPGRRRTSCGVNEGKRELGGARARVTVWRSSHRPVRTRANVIASPSPRFQSVFFFIFLQLTMVPLLELEGAEKEMSARGRRSRRRRDASELTCRTAKHEGGCRAR